MTPFEIIKRLIDNKYQAYFIGGYVRDKLIGIESDDIDIVTSARPYQLHQLFSDCSIKTVGESFGIVIIDGTEVATYRKDKYSTNSTVKIRYADSLQEDTERRDFTINAIAMTEDGIYIDFYNGLEDIKNRIIRFIGDPIKRIEEDPVRMLRACRFTAVLNGKLHPSAIKAIQQKHYLLKDITPERIRLEIMKAMKAKRAGVFFSLCHISFLLPIFLPELSVGYSLGQNQYHTKTVFEHNIITGDSISTKYPLLKLAGYLHDIGKSYVREFDQEKQDFIFYNHEQKGEELIKERLKELKFSTKEIKFISTIVRYHMRPISHTKNIKKLLHTLQGSDVQFKDMVRFKLADKVGKGNGKFLPMSFIKAILSDYTKILNYKEPFSVKHLAINGFDLMTKYNIPEGPKIGIILKQLFEKVLENSELNVREKLFELVEEMDGKIS